MLGVVLFCVLAAGLGAFYPVKAADEHGIGLRSAVGMALLIILYFFFAVILRIPLRESLLLVSLLAAAGVVAGLRRAFRSPRPIDAIAHPALLLPALGLAAVALHGGIGYIPYTTDEFSNWIGAARVIHWAGDYESVRRTIYLPDYTPGWRLLLLLPWQATGTIEFGLSAAAPFVLHAAVLALLYDIVAGVLQREMGLPPAIARLWGWAILLLFLAAEGMGRLWTYELLIEQPQIYTLSAVALLILKSELWDDGATESMFAAGLMLAAAYLLKSAALTTVPVVACLALIPLTDGTKPMPVRIRSSALAGAMLLGPVAVAAAAWSMVAPGNECLASMQAVLSKSGASGSGDWADLMQRYGLAIWSYVASYKTALTLAAVAAMVAALWIGLFRGILFCLGFAVTYLAILYGYHLFCFGDYYFRELNSIPRFTRVPLQVFHAIGLTLLVVTAARIGRRTEILLGFHPRFLLQKHAAVVGAAIAVAVLGGWQARQAYRSVTDVSTRADYRVDPRIGEMAQAAEFVERLAGTVIPLRPRLAVLGQGQDRDVLTYARFFGSRPHGRDFRVIFDLYRDTSWAPRQENPWSTVQSSDELLQVFLGMDVLWPLRLDPWLRGVLAELVPDASCLDSLPRATLIRAKSETGRARFHCVSKTP